MKDVNEVPQEDQAPSSRHIHSNELAAAINAAGAVLDTQDVAAPVAFEEIDAFKKATYLLIGAILTQHGRKAVQLTARELKKFESGEKQVVCVKTPNGGLRYEIQKKPKVKS